MRGFPGKIHGFPRTNHLEMVGEKHIYLSLLEDFHEFMEIKGRYLGAEIERAILGI